MAELVGAAVISAIAGVGASVSTAVTIGATGISLASAVGTVTLVAGSVALQALTTPNQTQRVASQQFSSRQPLPSRQRGYGWVKLAGPKIAYDSVGGSFYNAVYHAEGPIAGIDEVWLDDVLVPGLSGEPAAPAGIKPWLEKVRIECHLGSNDQAASTLLRGLSYWTSAHRLAGCAYTVMKATAPSEKSFPKFFPQSRWPETRVTARLSLVRDVRTDAQTADSATWQFSNRSGPCLYDFLTHPQWGLRVPDTLMDKASWAAFNALSDETLITKAGDLVPRYALGGLYQLTDDPADTLQAMLDTCDGRLTLQPDGTIGITGGKMPVPSVTLTDPAILSVTLEVGSGKLASFNRLKTSFVSFQHDYQQTEGDPWDDLVAQDYSGEILEQDFARPWVPSHNQLRRLAKIFTAKGNPQFRLTNLVTDRSGAPMLFEDAVHLVLTEYGIDAVFMVDRAVSNISAGTCTFDLTSLRADAYAFDATTEEGIAPVQPNQRAAAVAPDVPVNLTVAIERRAVSGTANATFARLTAVADRDDLSLIGRYRTIGSSAWLDMVQDGDNGYSVVSAVLTDGASYEVQGALATYGRALQSDWTAAAPDPITATADPTAPAQPGGFTATGAAGQVTIAWTDSGSANYAATRLYRTRSAGTTFSTATLIRTLAGSPNQAFSTVDASLPPDTYRYWLVAVNGSGAASDPLGPSDAVVS